MNFKLFIFIIFCISFYACNKDYVCNCKIITIGTTTVNANVNLIGIDTTIITPLYTENNKTTNFYNVSSNTAECNCINKTETINETTPTSIPGFFNVTSTNQGTRSYSCELN